MAKPLAGKRCLVVDDEFLIALDIQEMLEKAGAAEVVCVATVTEAIAAVRGGRFDLGVLDLRLGHRGGNSLPVAKALTDAGTPFVFLTGMRGDNAETRTYAAAPVIEKPYDGQSLLAAVTRIAGGQR